jgi:hypothetical protein
MLRGVWQPRDAKEIEAAVLSRTLAEGPHFDVKAQLPANNDELAKDIAAMTVDGGTLVYGVSEDKHGAATVLSPIALKGAAEKIDQIVQTSIAPPPAIRVQAHPKSDDASQGYLTVHVPASPLAPHQVTVGGDGRFYGRGATGNRRLAEAEIARLYERRQKWSVDRDALLDGEMSLAPPDSLAFLYGIARPAAAQEPLLEAASNGNELAHLQQTLDAFRSQSRAAKQFSPTLAEAAIWHRRGASGWIASSSPHDEAEGKLDHVAHFEVDVDGTCHFFLGRAGQVSTRANVMPKPPPTLYLFRDGVVDSAADFLFLASMIWEPSGYSGPVDVGLGLRGLRNAVPYELMNAMRPSRFSENEFRATARVDAVELGDPDRLAETMLRRFLEATGRHVSA